MPSPPSTPTPPSRPRKLSVAPAAVRRRRVLLDWRRRTVCVGDGFLVVDLSRHGDRRRAGRAFGVWRSGVGVWRTHALSSLPPAAHASTRLGASRSARFGAPPSSLLRCGCGRASPAGCADSAAAPWLSRRRRRCARRWRSTCGCVRSRDSPRAFGARRRGARTPPPPPPSSQLRGASGGGARSLPRCEDGQPLRSGRGAPACGAAERRTPAGCSARAVTPCVGRVGAHRPPPPRRTAGHATAAAAERGARARALAIGRRRPASGGGAGCVAAVAGAPRLPRRVPCGHADVEPPRCPRPPRRPLPH